MEMENVVMREWDGRAKSRGYRVSRSTKLLKITKMFWKVHSFIFILHATPRICETAKYEPAKSDGRLITDGERDSANISSISRMQKKPLIVT